MPKKNPAFKVDEDLSDLFRNKRTLANKAQGLPIEKALAVVVRNLESTGYRPRTISDYKLHVAHFTKVTGAKTLDELTTVHIYEWLASMVVSNQTKLTRLKCLKAFLRCCCCCCCCSSYGWLSETNFWQRVVVMVESLVRQGDVAKDVELLLHLLDTKDFVQLHDASALLLMSKTGWRVTTVANLEVQHVNLAEKLLKVDGGLLKNYQRIFLLISNYLARMLEVLMRKNVEVKKLTR